MFCTPCSKLSQMFSAHVLVKACAAAFRIPSGHLRTPHATHRQYVTAERPPSRGYDRVEFLVKNTTSTPRRTIQRKSCIAQSVKFWSSEFTLLVPCQLPDYLSAYTSLSAACHAPHAPFIAHSTILGLSPLLSLTIRPNIQSSLPDRSRGIQMLAASAFEPQRCSERLCANFNQPETLNYLKIHR